MKQISAVSLLQQPVLVEGQTEPGAKTVMLVFDTDRGLVMGLIVSSASTGGGELQSSGELQNGDQQFLPTDAILAIEKAGLRAAASLLAIDSGSAAAETLAGQRRILNLPAKNESGQLLGTVIDCNLRWPGLDIWQFIVQSPSGQRLMPKNQVKIITAEAVIFADDLAKSKFNWQAEVSPVESITT